MTFRFIVVLLLLSTGCAAEEKAAVAKEPEAIESPEVGGEVVTAARPSVVQVYSGDNQFAVEPIASGMIVSAEGLVATNKHVVSTIRNFRLRIWRKGMVTARFVAADPVHDVALLKIVAEPDATFPTATLSQTPPAMDEPLVVMGFPGNGGITYRQATVVELDASTTTIQGTKHSGMIRLSTDLGGGSSGGPVLDASALVVAMNTAGGGGVSLVSPIARVKAMLDTYGHTRLVRFTAIGFEAWSAVRTDTHGNTLKELHPCRVITGSLADDAGLLVGDVILRINDIPVADEGGVAAIAANLRPGTGTRFSVVRLDQTLELTSPARDEPTR